MRGTDPEPGVPEMPSESDTTVEPTEQIRTDGGEQQRYEHGAPLVPDCS